MSLILAAFYGNKAEDNFKRQGATHSSPKAQITDSCEFVHRTPNDQSNAVHRSNLNNATAPKGLDANVFTDLEGLESETDELARPSPLPKSIITVQSASKIIGTTPSVVIPSSTGWKAEQSVPFRVAAASAMHYRQVSGSAEVIEWHSRDRQTCSQNATNFAVSIPLLVPEASKIHARSSGENHQPPDSSDHPSEFDGSTHMMLPDTLQKVRNGQESPPLWDSSPLRHANERKHLSMKPATNESSASKDLHSSTQPQRLQLHREAVLESHEILSSSGLGPQSTVDALHDSGDRESSPNFVAKAKQIRVAGVPKTLVTPRKQEQGGVLSLPRSAAGSISLFDNSSGDEGPSASSRLTKSVSQARKGKPHTVSNAPLSEKRYLCGRNGFSCGRSLCLRCVV